MPPKAKITKDMVINAGLAIVREQGQENLNVRSIAAKLGCSTQPVMYHYTTVNELKADIYSAADELHTKYLLTPGDDTVGLRYIRFAHEEKHLFCFLFQSDKFGSRSFGDLIGSEELAPVLEPISRQTGLNAEQTREVFGMLFVCVHGIASLLANNSMDYDEEYFADMIAKAMTGAVCALKMKK